MARFAPATLDELRDAVSEALTAQEPFELIAGATKQGLGRPLQLPRTLDLSGLAGIRDYEPSELVLTVGAATPLDEIEVALGQAGQMLAFEPPDWTGLFGLSPPQPAGQHSGACSPAISQDLAGSRRALRATTSSGFAGSAVVARCSKRAAKSSRT